MSVYVIASLTIKDAGRFEDYRRMLLPKLHSSAIRFCMHSRSQSESRIQFSAERG